MRPYIFINVGTGPEGLALLDRLMNPPAAPMPESAPKAVMSPPAPAADQAQPGERYAGIVLDENGKPDHHLYLLEAKPEKKLKWQAAIDWAESVGGALPTRFESALLYANLHEQFEQSGWYWTSTQGSATYAWIQVFYDGGQYDSGKSYEGLARAVRRLVI